MIEQNLIACMLYIHDNRSETQQLDKCKKCLVTPSSQIPVYYELNSHVGRLLVFSQVI